MLNIVITGKPASYEPRDEKESPFWAGEFRLAQRLWTKELGSHTKIWICVVPRYNEAHILRKIEKGFTVTVIASSVDISEDLNHMVLGLTDVQDV